MSAQKPTEPGVGSAPVLIVGAGCTGLALAQGLKKAGVKCVVFEREPPNLLRARDWNFGVHWSIPILQALIPPESFAQVESAQVDPNRPCPPSETIRFLHGVTGEQIGASETPHIYRLRRSKLRSILAEGLDIQYDKTLASIVYSDDGELVTAHFADGTTVDGTLLVGTDGHRSLVRTLLVGPEKAALTQLEYGAAIVQAKYTAERVKYLRAWHPLYVAGVHPAGMLGWVGLHHAPDANDPENWIMNHYISWASSLEEQEKTKDWTNEQRLKQLKDLAAQFTEPFRSAFAWLKDDQVVWYSPLSQWDPSLEEHQWDNRGGRVTLAGDAAHPMTFQRGQGLNSGVKDAEVLVHCIQGFLGPSSEGLPQTKTRQQAIDAYEAEMKDRAGTEVRLSCANTQMVHQWDKVLQSPLVSKGFAQTQLPK